MEQLFGLSVHIRAGDVELFAHVSRGDSLGELVGGLVVKFRNLAMAILMFDDVGSYAGRHPDGDVELKRHLDLRDGDGRVRGICWTSLAADTGAG